MGHGSGSGWLPMLPTPPRALLMAGPELPYGAATSHSSRSLMCQFCVCSFRPGHVCPLLTKAAEAAPSTIACPTPLKNLCR